ncbi:F-box/kelch-repeat protein [Rosa sericea]
MTTGLRHQNKQLVPSGGRPHIESDDLLIDILSRLPVKTLIQFRCVCKSWRALISDSHLVTMHLRRFNRRRRLLFSVAPFQSIDITALNDAVCSVSSTSLALPIPVETLKIVGSCNGLICLVKNSSLIIFWNPSTRVTRFLPMPNHSHLGIVMFYGFGYDPTIDDYKVVFGCKGERNGALATAVVMFQLKTGSWRIIDGLDYVNLNGQGCLINGSLHWVEMKWEAGVTIRPVLSARIMCFDLAEETFQELIPLSYLSREYISARIGIAENSLFVYIYNSSEITMWVMKESWTKVMQIPTEIPQLPVGYCYSFSTPICILENGEVLMNSNGKYLVLYSPNGGACVNVLETPVDLAPEPAMYVESLVSPFKENI